MDESVEVESLPTNRQFAFTGEWMQKYERSADSFGPDRTCTQKMKKQNRVRSTCYSDTNKSTPGLWFPPLWFGVLFYEASSIGPSSSPSARLARISIRVRAKRPQSSVWANDSCREHQRNTGTWRWALGGHTCMARRRHIWMFDE